MTPHEWLMADFQHRLDYPWEEGRGQVGAVRALLAFLPADGTGTPYHWKPGDPHLHDGNDTEERG